MVWQVWHSILSTEYFRLVRTSSRCSWYPCTSSHTSFYSFVKPSGLQIFMTVLTATSLPSWELLTIRFIILRTDTTMGTTLFSWTGCLALFEIQRRGNYKIRNRLKCAVIIDKLFTCTLLFCSAPIGSCPNLEYQLCNSLISAALALRGVNSFTNERWWRLPYARGSHLMHL